MLGCLAGGAITRSRHEDGANQWRAPVATGWMNDVCVDGDTVFVSTGEYLVALDRVTGPVLYGVKQCPREAWSRWSTML